MGPLVSSTFLQDGVVVGSILIHFSFLYAVWEGVDGFDCRLEGTSFLCIIHGGRSHVVWHFALVWLLRP